MRCSDVCSYSARIYMVHDAEGVIVSAPLRESYICHLSTGRSYVRRCGFRLISALENLSYQAEVHSCLCSGRLNLPVVVTLQIFPLDFNPLPSTKSQGNHLGLGVGGILATSETRRHDLSDQLCQNAVFCSFSVSFISL